MVDSLIRLFEQNIEPTYNSSTTRWDWVGLGIGVISDAISCKVEEERNGKYELVMEYPTTGARFNELQINRILVTNPNQSSDPQGFRIYEITKNMDRTATIYAEHISYQLAHVPILPLSATNCKQALDALFNSANQGEECHFTYYTDKTSTYFPATSGSVRTGDYEGRSLQLDWSLTSQTDSASVVSWTLKGVGKLANYTNGWVMCGPINLSIGDTQILVNAHNHPNRVQLYEGTIADQGSVTLTHTAGKFSAQINLDCILYYDYNVDGRGKVTGSANMTLPDLSGGGTADVSQAGEFKIEVPTSLRSALGGGTGSVLDVYGGEFEWDNLTVKLHSARGRDNGVTIRYGKNLTSLEQEETIANTYTGILPYWRGQEPDDKETADDGAIVIVTPTHILRNGVALPDIPAAVDRSGQTVTKDAVYSSNADLYPYKRTSPEDVTEYFNGYETEEEYDSSISQFERFWSQVPMPQDVYNVATELVAGSSLGVPEVNLDVEFVPLWQTEEYRNLAMQESVGLCDVVHVYFEELGVTVSAKVVKYTFDVLLNRYESIELSSTGTLKTTLASTIASTPELIDAATQETQHFVTAKLEDATNTITGVYGGRMITNKDENGNPYELVFAGDPDSDGTYGNFMRINKEGIGFSTQGYNGPFNSAWTIDGTFDAQQINVINLNADSMTGGTLKSQNYDTSGGTAGFSANLNTGEFTAPSLEVSITAAATSAANSYTDTQISAIPGQISSAVSEAKNYADDKASDAETNAKSYADSKITQTASSITSTVTEKIDQIQIGGTNILTDSEYMTSWYRASRCDLNYGVATLHGTTDNWNALLNTSKFDADLYDGTTTYVLSFDYRSTEACYVCLTTASTAAMIQSTSYARTKYFDTYYTLPSTNGVWTKYTFEPRTISKAQLIIGSGDIVSGYFSLYARTNDVDISVRHWKLEKGTKATDWSPAPTDAYRDVGGRNLLLDSFDKPGQSTSGYVICSYDFAEHLIAGELYTISAKFVTSSEKLWVGFYHSGGTYAMTPWLPIRSDQTYVHTFTATESMASQTSGAGYGYCNAYASNNPNGAQSGMSIAGTAHVDWIKIEKGEHNTDWSPAPEDMTDYVDRAVASQAQTTTSQISQLSDRITSTVTTVNNIQQNMLDTADVNALIAAGNFATSSSVSQTSSALQVQITQAQNTANAANSTAQLITTGVTVDSNGVTVGKSDSAVKGVFANNSLEFKSGGKAIAWLSATSEEGLGVDTIQIGNHNTANQRWIIFTSSDGSHLSFTRHQ